MNTQVTNIALDMLDNPSSGEGSQFETVMHSIHTIKVYNPKPGEAPDPAKAGKILLKEANTQEEKVLDAPVTFNILSILEAMSGMCYPVDAKGVTGDKEEFFTTNEYSRFTRKTEPVMLRGGSKVLGAFAKGDLQQLLRSPLLNGQMNPFYKKGKTSDGKPYDTSELSRTIVLYGAFRDGPYKGEYFRMFVKPNYFGITYKNGETVQPDEGTIEYTKLQGLKEFNDIRIQNKRSSVNSIDESQLIIDLDIKKNDRGNFLPEFKYNSLQLTVGSNKEDIEFIHGLQQEHFKDSFGEMSQPTPISIDGGAVTIAPQVLAIESNGSVEHDFLAENAQEVKQEPAEVEEITQEDLNAALNAPY